MKKKIATKAQRHKGIFKKPSCLRVFVPLWLKIKGDGDEELSERVVV